jgi:hypothetical protein
LGGLALAASSLGILRRSNWALKRARLIPFVRAANVALLSQAPAVEDLLEAVGAGRAARTPERVAAAECELRDRLARAHQEHARRVRRWGAIAIGLGLYATVGSSCFLLQVAMAARNAPPDARHLRLMLWVGAINLWFGTGLTACGVGLRRRREWARRTLLRVLWAYLALMMALVVGMAVGMMAWLSVPVEDLPAVLASAAVLAAFWCAVFRTITRSLGDAATREVCRPAKGDGVSRERASRRRRGALVAAVVVAGLLLASSAAHVVWRPSSARALQAELERLRQSGAVLDLQAWQPTAPAPEENAAALVRKAAAEMERAEERMREEKLPHPEMPAGGTLTGWTDLLDLATWTPAQAGYAQHVLQHQSEALETLRDASRLPHADFGWNYAEWFPAMVELSPLGDGVRLMCLSSLAAHRERDHARAVADAAAALRLARFPDRDPMLIVHLSRMSRAARATRCCGALLGTPAGPAQLLATLDAALQDARRGLDLGRCLEYERAWAVRGWEVMRSGQWELLDMEPPGRLEARLVRPLLASRMAALLPLTTEAVHIARKPIWEAVPGMRQLVRDIERADRGRPGEPRVTTDVPSLSALLPAYARGAQEHADCDALLDSMRIAIALRRCRADRGLPASAPEDLTPDYLAEVPPDPYTGGQLLVRREAGFVTVYSVGLDLTDDGGSVDEGPGGMAALDVGVRIWE